MPLLAEPLYVATVLVLLVFAAEWLARQRFLRYVGSALLVILLAAVLANVGLLPSSQRPSALYGAVFTYVAPLAIFFLLLDVRLRELRHTSLPMLGLFLLGAAGTVAGTLVGYAVLAPQRQVAGAFALAGMFAGTDIGGSINFNAVALQYHITQEGALYTAATVADNILSAAWIGVTLLLPRLLQQWRPRTATTSAAPPVLSPTPDHLTEPLTVPALALLFCLGLGTLLLSEVCSRYFPAVPSILVLTTVALLLAQWPVVQRLRGSKVMGYFLVLLFLAVVGAYCDVRALVQNGRLALLFLGWDTLIILVHGLLLFGVGALLRKDWVSLGVASNANIGGAATAAVCATSLGRPDLQLPGILVGSIGNALGTYVGVLLAELLR